jgi:cell division protein FtsL
MVVTPREFMKSDVMRELIRSLNVWLLAAILLTAVALTNAQESQRVRLPSKKKFDL